MSLTKMSRKERIAGWGIVAATFFCSGLLSLPVYYEYSAIGDIVPVEDIGVDGSVYFTYVEGGYTENLADKLLVAKTADHAEFIPVDRNVIEMNNFYMEMDQVYKEETIQNAVDSASGGAGEAADDLEAELNEIVTKTEEYYGESFGLMLALGLTEQWHGLDFSKGGKYKIAGTGTLEADNTVGSIGYVKAKLFTAELNNVDYFFVPKDKDRFEYEGLSNEEEAKKLDAEENFPFEIVYVDTLDDALKFLETLQ
ncbi:hypothetical protein CU633_19200 [Bacillus sp. V3-13]|uniref:hypothetical protein n=1 Tax=Bacillus sp. V3-13 TaxID=2053728 RepID=UPI000C771ED9|nr:hypothetical protein [Bacillus sp. V3-13]PLR75766.1 hypothetical protein CU633_19200 [Bacillus sp. V3-13]